MQKAKKMSKQTLVIAVLAVLLVLSLALTVTGAWFTDTAEGSSETTIQFATVAISDATLARDEAVTLEGNRDLTNILPDDEIALKGSVSTTGTTVDIYVAFYLSGVTVTGTYDGGTVDLTAVVGEDIDVTNVSIAAENGITGTDVAKNVTAVQHDDLTIYKVAIAAGEVTFNYEGGVAFADSLTNYYTYTDGKTYVLNDNGQVEAGDDTIVITGATISANLKVAAIQADNIEETAAVAQLETLVGYGAPQA